MKDAELETIQTVVSYVERSLKLVSDQLTNQADEGKANGGGEQPAAGAAVPPAATTATVAAPSAAPTGTSTATPPQRMLKGVMRVGLLAKGLLLKGDREVQLVVLCSQPPTFQLLDRVAQALPAHLAVSRLLFYLGWNGMLTSFLL